MNVHPVSVASLGRIAAIGDLYDCRNDAFSSLSVFRKAIPTTAITTTDDPDMKTEYVYTDKVSDKFRKLDVSAALQVSVLGGMITLEGSGRYLNDQKTSARAVKISLIYSIKTKHEKLNIFHDDLKDAFAISAIENDSGTHVVTGISWGANSIISCTSENRENRDVREISGKMSAFMQKLTWSIKEGKAEVDHKESDNTKDVSFEIKVYGDILPSKEDLPTTFEAALELVKQIPTLVTASNSGKGKPLTYQLTPIHVLQNHLKFETNSIGVKLQTVEESSLLRVVQFVESLSAAQQELNDFYQDALDFKFCIKPEKLENFAELKHSVALLISSFKMELSATLTDIRSGNSTTSKLEELLCKFEQHDKFPKSVASITGWREITEKIAFAQALTKSRAKYIGFGSSLDAEIIKDFEKKSYILYFSWEGKESDLDRWNANRQIFFQEMKNLKTECKFYAVDTDLCTSYKFQEKSSYVEVLKQGKVLVVDLLEGQERCEIIPWAKPVTKPEKISYKPNERGAFTVKCTGNTCDPDTVYAWMCFKCKNLLEYGFDSFVYCSCGKSLAVRLTFKCADPNHGVNFESHDKKFLTDEISKLRRFKEVNILILGETGVGKSTWINGFFNFLNHESLEKAMEGELLTLIPTKFTIWDENNKSVVVTAGPEDKNENTDPGKSATRSTKVYTFSIGNTLVRLIDTPGIGDTAGYDQDQKNFQNILGTLSYLKELHGICILLKPNNSKIHVMFRFCIKELLTNLHKDASKNIVFCFTNSRNTFYRPGDTMPALEKLLSENGDVGILLSKQTVYCFDSEAYRFLAATKNKPPVIFNQEEKECFSKSWNKSIQETTRMLEHIIQLKPHDIQNTVNLNFARASIIQLTKPLAEVNQMITNNKKLVEREMENLKKNKVTRADLEKQKMTTRKQIKFIKRDFPRTVCSNIACCQTRHVGELQRKVYPKYCHDPCTLRGFPGDTIGDPELLRCLAMNNGVCMKCNHSYSEHLHTYIEVYDEDIQVEDQAVVDLLRQNFSVEETKLKLIKIKEKEAKLYKLELETIKSASAYFAYFLKNNAITPYNDGMEEYLDHLIREEKVIVAGGGDGTKLKNLEECKASYIQQRKLLDEQMSSCDARHLTPPRPEDIARLIKELKNLKVAGKLIVEALECLKYTTSVVYNEIPVYHTSSGLLEKAGKFLRKIYKLFS